MGIHVVGFGPGSFDGMTIEAKSVLDKCDLIVGYEGYIDLIKPYFSYKQFYSTPNTQETQMCRYAIRSARDGMKVAVLSDGDSGVYGMASLIYEIAEEFTSFNKEIKIIPGVTAAVSCASILGAPLSHDFAVISMSDMLTSFDTIQKRIEYAAMSDMVICLYNTAGRIGSDYLRKACKIAGRHISQNTVCGYVRNAGRENVFSKILRLIELEKVEADMFTTVFIGNANTKIIRGKMVTPKGDNFDRNIIADRDY